MIAGKTVFISFNKALFVLFQSTERLAETIPLVSGTFVCPQDGTYMFRASGLAETGKELKIKLYKDNKCIAAVFANDGNVVGNVAIIRMNSGDRLYVQVKQDGQCVVETSNEENQFYSTLTYAIIAAGLETSSDSGNIHLIRAIDLTIIFHILFCHN